MARTGAASKLQGTDASTEALATVKAEGASQEAGLASELRAEDALLTLKREQTDRVLQQERAISDEEMGRIVTELAEAVRFRDEFLAMASHELRTPLTPLSLRLQSLAQDAARQPDSPFVRRVTSYMEAANDRLKRLTSLTASLLDVSHMIVGQMSLELGPVDFGEVLSAVTARMKVQAQNAGCVLEVESAKATGRWDEVRLEQAVICLLDNALKFGAGKPVRVRLQATSEKALLTVTDEGIGIGPEHLSRIFQRFERAVSNAHYGGLGLGLYICRTIVEAMGGTVSAVSELGKGSTFMIELPRSGPKVRV